MLTPNLEDHLIYSSKQESGTKLTGEPLHCWNGFLYVHLSVHYRQIVFLMLGVGEDSFLYNETPF